ncbi:hypothetical protein N7516_010620 [Penicillium verrucosum]|uniref:uncharacterized protein n=1 Tax=Penicillium verrucosum TaxID=60171 RepID=UPI0025450396|nr:uncharacterized protein N7516_010620 [Penicillium verrucosum]KAJ5922917.1 hypothetical protein N7516_010620 [Penicillium verrucosum]
MHYLKPTLPFILAVATLASAETTTDTLADNAVNTACTSETCYTNCAEYDCPNAEAHAPISTAASTISSGRAAATGSTDIEDGIDISDSGVKNDFTEEHPVLSYSGLEANSIPRPEEGTAAGLRVGAWLGFLGLALGLLF